MVERAFRVTIAGLKLLILSNNYDLCLIGQFFGPIFII